MLGKLPSQAARPVRESENVRNGVVQYVPDLQDDFLNVRLSVDHAA
jgi:hypothetical protein